jgi:hypothetical protein
MTAEQISAWCAEHKMIVTIEAHPVAPGEIKCIITAQRDEPDERIPIFLRRQAE